MRTGGLKMHHNKEQGHLFKPAHSITGNHVFTKEPKMQIPTEKLAAWFGALPKAAQDAIVRPNGYVPITPAVTPKPLPPREPHQRRGFYKKLASEANPGEFKEFVNTTGETNAAWARKLSSALKARFKEVVVEEVQPGVIQLVSWGLQPNAQAGRKVAQYVPYGHWTKPTEPVTKLVVGQTIKLPVPTGEEPKLFHSAVCNRARRAFGVNSCRSWTSPGVVHIRRDV